MFTSISRIVLFAMLGLSTGFAQASDLIIGGLIPLSGPNAVYAPIFTESMDSAVKYVNQSGLLKQSLKIAYEDSQGFPQQGVIGMNKLVHAVKVPYVLSAFTGVTKAIGPICDKTQTVAINGGGVGPDLAELGDYVWNNVPLVNDQLSTSLPFLVNNLNIRKFAVIYVDDPLGRGVLETLTQQLPVINSELIGQYAISALTTSFSAQLNKIAQSKPDAIYIASYGEQLMAIVKAIRDYGIESQLLSYSGVPPQLYSMAEADGMIITNQAMNWNDPADETLEFNKAAANSKALKGAPAAKSGFANYYNGVLLFAKLAATLEQEGKPITGQNLLESMRSMRKFQLAGGEVSFRTNGTISSPIQLDRITGDRVETLATLRAGQ